MDIYKLYSLFLKNPKICTDTRNIVKDSIFFALKGESFNGNKFADDAVKKGCAYAVIDQAEYKKSDKYSLGEDTLKALQELAKLHRKQLKIPFLSGEKKLSTPEIHKISSLNCIRRFRGNGASPFDA